MSGGCPDVLGVEHAARGSRKYGTLISNDCAKSSCAAVEVRRDGGARKVGDRLTARLDATRYSVCVAIFPAEGAEMRRREV